MFDDMRDFVQAEVLARESLELAKQLLLPKLSYLASTTLAQAYLGQSKSELAAECLNQAIDLVEGLRKQVAGQEQERLLFFEKKISPYHLLISILIGQRRNREAFTLAERSKGRVLLDLFGRRELGIVTQMTPEQRREEQRLNSTITQINSLVRIERLKVLPDQTSLKHLTERLDSARLAYTVFQDFLATQNEISATNGEGKRLPDYEIERVIGDPGTAVLEFVVTPECTWLFVVSRNGRHVIVNVHQISIAQRDLDRLVGEFHLAVAERMPGYEGMSHKMYDLLVKPAERELRTKTTICIIPDGSLWRCPFRP